jgi:GDPmannose 4,6-dehydratase
MFGASPPPQNETTPFRPRSPYGIAKLFAHWTAVNYREAYGFPISCGILFNHESPVRGENFVTQKIARAAAKREHVALGNLNAERDWGHARDYVEGIWRMMQIQPDDFVLATGTSRTVRDFANIAYNGIIWEGSGLDEIGWGIGQPKELMGFRVKPKIVVDPAYFRPLEVDRLCGDAGKARRVLGWEPRISFETMVQEMVNAAR